jgi:hypothetical protein
MDMKEKIKNTRLFTNLEKIELLTKIDIFSSESIKQLESIIDDYDQSLKEIKSEFNFELEQEIEKLQQITTDPNSIEALATIKTGLNKILS